MNEEKLIEALKNYLEPMKEALEKQNPDGQKYTVEDWVYSAIASFAKLNPDWSSFMETGEQEDDAFENDIAQPPDIFEQHMAKILEQETSEDMQKIRKLILKRIATESDVKQARIPAPVNITEIGGYYNLIEKDDVMRPQMLAQILGLPYISIE